MAKYKRALFSFALCAVFQLFFEILARLNNNSKLENAYS
jgi:hypothetical protein